MDKIERIKKGEKATLIATLVAFFLAVSKGIVGFLANNTALISDAVNNFGDLVTSIVSYMGIRISRKKPDQTFKYGYYKAESIATLVLAMFILYAGYELVKLGYGQLFHQSALKIPLLALAVSLVSVLVSLYLSLFLKKTGNQIGSDLLIATSMDRLADVFSSSLVFISLVLTYYNIPYAEGIMTLVMAVFIIRIGLLIGKDAVFALMDVSPSGAIEEKVSQAIKSTKGVEDFKHLRLRRAGLFIFGDVHVKVKKTVSLHKAHSISDRIEDEIERRVKEIEYFSVHIEPFESKKKLIALTMKDNKGLDSDVINHIGRANYFLFAKLDNEKIKSFRVEKNPFKEKKMKSSLYAAHFLAEKDVDAVITSNIGEIPFHVLQDHMIDIYASKKGAARDDIDHYIAGKLKRIRAPAKKKRIILK